MSARRIRALRERLGLTQEQFAQRIGVSFTSVNRWEHGAVPSPMAQRLLDGLAWRCPCCDGPTEAEQRGAAASWRRRCLAGCRFVASGKTSENWSASSWWDADGVLSVASDVATGTCALHRQRAVAHV